LPFVANSSGYLLASVPRVFHGTAATQLPHAHQIQKHQAMFSRLVALGIQQNEALLQIKFNRFAFWAVVQFEFL
jgi:hypothetical protein